MGVVQHAALHAHGQHIIWQQVFMKLKDTFPVGTCQRELPTNIRCITFKKVINGSPELLGLGGSRSWPGQRGGLDRIQFRKILVDVRLALLGDLILVRTTVAVVVVAHLDRLHPLSIDVAERRKPFPVETFVVLQIDKDLRRARVWHARFRVRQVATLVGLRNWLILEIGPLPRGRDGRIGAYAKLHDEAGHHAEEAGVVIEVVFHQIVKTVGANGRPGTIHGHNKIAAGGGELHLESLRRFFLEKRCAKQGAIIALARRGCWRARCYFGLRGRWRFRLRLRRSLRLGLFRRLRFRSLFFRLTAEKQSSHCYRGDKPLYAFHFRTSPQNASFRNLLRCSYFFAFISRLTRSTSAMTRRVFSPRIFLTSASEYPFFNNAS